MADTSKNPGNMRDKAQGAGHAVGQAAQSAGQRVGEATHRAGEAASNIGERAQQVASAAGERAGQAVQSVAQGMSSLADTLRHNAPREGMLGTAASAVAGGLEASGQYLQEHDLSDIGDDLATFFRRYPIACVAGAFGLGLLLGSMRR